MVMTDGEKMIWAAVFASVCRMTEGDTCYRRAIGRACDAVVEARRRALLWLDSDESDVQAKIMLMQMVGTDPVAEIKEK